jgi:hypothetical protein
LKADFSVKFLLCAIAASLAAIALHPYVAPSPVFAESSAAYPFYVEPGATMLRAPDGKRQVMGKVMIDMRTGDVWGFPTSTQAPYPIDEMKIMSPISHPFLLGKFAFADVDRSGETGGE